VSMRLVKRLAKSKPTLEGRWCSLALCIRFREDVRLRPILTALLARTSLL